MEKRFEVTLSRVYEVIAFTEEQAKEKVYRELDGDIEFGFADASEDSFSCKIKEIKI